MLFGEDGAVVDAAQGRRGHAMRHRAGGLRRALGERLAKTGHELLDAPMSGGRARAESGELTFMASGAPTAFAARREHPVGDLGQGVPPRRRAGHRLAGQDGEPAAGRRAHRDRGRGDGARRQGRRRHARGLRGDLGQRRQFVDVRQSRAAHARRRLFAALRGRDLRQGSRAGAEHRPRASVAAADGRGGAPALPRRGGRGLGQARRRRRGEGLRAGGRLQSVIAQAVRLRHVSPAFHQDRGHARAGLVQPRAAAARCSRPAPTSFASTSATARRTTTSSGSSCCARWRRSTSIRSPS